MGFLKLRTVLEDITTGETYKNGDLISIGYDAVTEVRENETPNMYVPEDTYEAIVSQSLLTGELAAFTPKNIALNDGEYTHLIDIDRIHSICHEE